MDQKIKIVYKKIDELIPVEYNPRSLAPEKRHELRESLEGFGGVAPAVINTAKGRENRIISGEQRTKVAKEDLGWEEFPCVEVEIEDLEKEKQLNIRLNVSAGSWDKDLLAEFFNPDELDMWGLDIDLDMQIDNAEDGEEIEFEQSVQIEPPMEYIVLLAEPNSEEWENLKEHMKLKKVRRGGYKKGSAFDQVGLERVIPWGEFKERFLEGNDADSSTK